MTFSLIGLAFIIIPVAEIALFIVVGQHIGLWLTLAGILITAVLGATLLRHQGLHTLREAQARLGRGEAPVRQLFDGLCLFVAGAFLLTPGFLTDIAGFILLVPGFRQILGGALWRMLQRRGMVMNAAMHTSAYGGEPGAVDAEYRVVDPPEPVSPDEGRPGPPIRPRGPDGRAGP